MSRVTWVGVAAAVALVLAGCSHRVAGSPVSAADQPSSTSTVDLTLLDPGNYSTKPLAPRGNADNPARGALIEAHRMATNVVGPWEVDATLLTGSVQTGSVKDTAALTSIFGGASGDVAAAHNFVTGFSSVRGAENDQKALINVVVRFASAEDATAAAAEMATRDASLPGATADDPETPTTPITIPRYSDTPAVTYSPSLTPDLARVRAYTAHGTFVLCQEAGSKDGADSAAELVAATLDKQIPLIDQFSPTAVDQLSNLPIDSSGVLARTLPPESADGTVNDGVYQPHGALHFLESPVALQTVFDSAGLQLSVRGKTHVYQAPDAAAAGKIVDGFAASATGQKLTPAGGVNGMPDAKCFAKKDSDGKAVFFYCLAAVNQYAIEAASRQELDAQQQIAAQYLLLTAK